MYALGLLEVILLVKVLSPEVSEVEISRFLIGSSTLRKRVGP